MGGNAIVDSKRMAKTEYKTYCKILKKYFNPRSAYIPQSIKSKESFGDIDILCSFSKSNFKEILKKIEQDGFIKIESEAHDSFGVRFYINGTWSDIHQVDWIQCRENREFHLNYLGFNDLGNFIGRIAAYHQLKFGENGLYKTIHFDKNGNHLTGVTKYKSTNNLSEASKVASKKDILLTADWNLALEYLGFNSEDWHDGFETLEEVAEFVMNSKYFNPKMFDLQDRDAKSRARDKKRSNYEYVSNYFNNHATVSFDSKPQVFLGALNTIFTSFPSFSTEYRKEVKEMKSLAQYESRFKGKHILKLLNQLGVDVVAGKFISKEHNMKENLSFSWLMAHLKKSMNSFINDNFSQYGSTTKAHSVISKKEWNKKMKEFIVDYLDFADYFATNHQ